MTVVLATAIQNFIGLSSDTKPTAPPAGSFFYETDTGASYIYDGAAWRVQLDKGVFRIVGTRTFDGAAGNGAVGAATFFTVTGEILAAAIIPFCTLSLEEAAPTASITLGVTSDTALFLANPTGGATAIDTGEFWLGTTPKANGEALPAALKDIVITDNILAQIAAQAVNGGTLRVSVFWRPISADGKVALAAGVS